MLHNVWLYDDYNKKHCKSYNYSSFSGVTLNFMNWEKESRARKYYCTTKIEKKGRQKNYYTSWKTYVGEAVFTVKNISKIIYFH